MAKLYYRYGAMNSGKSTMLIQVAHNYSERGQKAFIVKPKTDTRSEGIFSRIGAEKEPDLHAPSDMNIREQVLLYRMNNLIDCVLVDEAQFLTEAQVWELFLLAVHDNIPVIAYGLRGDFRTTSFPGSLRLMELAHAIEELKTICRCGRKATLNGRKVNNEFTTQGDQVAIEGEVGYESLCGTCYVLKIGLSDPKLTIEGTDI